MQVDRFLCPIYNALRNNELFAVAFGGRDGSKWVTTNFFERTALFLSGPFELARRKGSTILPAFVIRGRNLTTRLFLSFLLSYRLTLTLKKPYVLIPKNLLNYFLFIESDTRAILDGGYFR